MSLTIDWEKYLTEMVTNFRKEFEKLSLESQKQIREKVLNHTLLEPCQIEVLDYGVRKGVIVLIIHDNRFPDMMFKIHEDVKGLDVSEFFSKYKNNFHLLREEKYKELQELAGEAMHFHMNNVASLMIGEREPPQRVAQMFLSSAKEALKDRQVDVIERSTSGLKKSIAKIPEKDVRDELLETTQKIDGALQEIKRIDEKIGKVRQLVGVSQEYQDWKILVSDVHRLKGEHVPREVFETKIDELNTRIGSLFEIKEAYDKILAQQTEFMKQQSEVIKQQSSFIKWIKYATILVPIAVVSVPVIEILLRHFLGIP